MRDIKFRVWNGSQMIDDVTVGKHGAFWTSGIAEHDSASLGNTTIYHETTPVMQFTGLKDKNGKEIYEGDICIHSKVPNMDAIKYRKPFEVRYGKGAQFYGFVDGWLGDAHLYDLEGYKYEIIGNIHENPELIKG